MPVIGTPTLKRRLDSGYPIDVGATSVTLIRIMPWDDPCELEAVIVYCDQSKVVVAFPLTTPSLSRWIPSGNIGVTVHSMLSPGNG